MGGERGVDHGEDPIQAEPRLAREMLAFAKQHVSDARAELERAYERDDEERIARARESLASAESLLGSARERLDAAHRLAALDPDAILQHIRDAYAGLDVLTTPDAHFVYYDPARDTPHDKRQPFATIVLTDASSDAASDLSRRGLYRLNLGVTRETYRAMLGPEPSWGPPPTHVVETGHDLTEADVWLPHPIYAPMSWVCIVAPTERSWPRVRELLDEAYEKARRLKRGPVADGA